MIDCSEEQAPMGWAEVKNRIIEDQAKRIAELEAGLAAVTAERDALKADAGRWRWLLNEHSSDGPSWHVRLPNNEVPGVDLSALIDAAIKEQQ